MLLLLVLWFPAIPVPLGLCFSLLFRWSLVFSCQQQAMDPKRQIMFQDHETKAQRKRTGTTTAHDGVLITTGVSIPLKKTNATNGLGLAETAAQSRPPQ